MLKLYHPDNSLNDEIEPSSSTYFVIGRFGVSEKDYRVIDNMLPKMYGKPHPNPQHWYNLKHLAKKRDGNRCVTCNKKGKLDLHHRTYERWGRERLSDVYLLCRECHELFTFRYMKKVA